MAYAMIVVPTEGKHVRHFGEVAKTVKRRVYAGKASIVGASTETTSAGEELRLKKIERGPGDKDADLTAFITISHGGPLDGPILGEDDLGVGQQPFSSKPASTALTKEAAIFWRRVGKSLTKVGSGKIVLVGCNMGASHYAQRVAEVAKVPVYASTESFAAADNETVVKHLKAIEAGKPIKPMKRFKA